MFNLKAYLLVGLLLLTSDVLAVRVTYSATFVGQKVGERTSRLATVDDDKAESIVENMGKWSNDRYQAANGRHMVLVTNKVAAASRKQATDMIEDMQRVVKDNYVPPSNTPDPGHGGNKPQ